MEAENPLLRQFPRVLTRSAQNRLFWPFRCGGLPPGAKKADELQIWP